MSPIFTIISALLPFVVTELQQFKVISPQVGSLITGVEGAASAFTTEITSSTTGQVSITAAGLLAGIQAALTVLQQQTTISPTTLSLIVALDKAVQAGLAATAITSVDPTKLQPIATVA